MRWVHYGSQHLRGADIGAVLFHKPGVEPIEVEAGVDVQPREADDTALRPHPVDQRLAVDPGLDDVAAFSHVGQQRRQEGVAALEH